MSSQRSLSDDGSMLQRLVPASRVPGLSLIRLRSGRDEARFCKQQKRPWRVPWQQRVVVLGVYCCTK